MNEQKTILVVDDDAIFSRIIGRHLDQAGFRVLHLASGVGVADQVRTLKPVACIIDMVMPDKDGIETILELIKMPDRPKIIGVSGTKLHLDFADGLEVDATLLKPVTPEMLTQALQTLQVLNHAE